MSHKKTLALLGGPGSGKTTYLSALVDALQAARLSDFALAGWPEDARALMRLAEPLLEGRYPQRTKHAERQDLEAPLRTDGKRFEETSFSLRVGDYAGEELELLFQDRGWSPEWEARASADALLLFVRFEAFVPLPKLNVNRSANEWEALPRRGRVGQAEVRLVPASASASDPTSVFGVGLAEEAPPRPRPSGTDPVRMPTALSIVELLQFVRHVRDLAPGERPEKGSFRIAILVSAWDAVDPSWRALGPNRFLSEIVPLLEDYLWSNFHGDDVFRFGVSATAGDLRRERERERYLEDPQGFVEWADAAGQIHNTSDIAKPIAWALFGDRVLR